MKPAEALPLHFGYIAEFSSAPELVEAAGRAYHAGYRQMDAYSPFPIHGLSEALGQRPTVLPWLVFAGGLIGGFAGYMLQFWTSAIDYPLNVGGRGLNSWPAFIPITFECIVLFAAFAAVLGMFAMNGLPRPHHPIFSAKNFERASVDRFFLCIEATDPLFDPVVTRRFLEGLNPHAVSEVEH